MQLANGRLGTYFVRTKPPEPTSPKFVAERKLTFLQRRVRSCLSSPKCQSRLVTNFLSGRVSVTVPADASFLFAGRR